MRYDVAAEAAKYRAEMAEYDKSRREQWKHFAEWVREKANENFKQRLKNDRR